MSSHRSRILVAPPSQWSAGGHEMVQWTVLAGLLTLGTDSFLDQGLVFWLGLCFLFHLLFQLRGGGVWSRMPWATSSPYCTASTTPFRRAVALKSHLSWSQSPSHLVSLGLFVVSRPPPPLKPSPASMSRFSYLDR
eukprot:96687_1